MTRSTFTFIDRLSIIDYSALPLRGSFKSSPSISERKGGICQEAAYSDPLPVVRYKLKLGWERQVSIFGVGIT